MKRLTLVRHADAAWKDAKTSDYDRPLTRIGQSEATVLGHALLRGKLTPDLIISSAAQRARQTAEILARELSIPPNFVRYDEGLYLAEVPQILHAVQANGPRLAHLMMVGHNPCISELARLLAPRADIRELETASACTMTFDVAGWLEIEPATALECRVEPARHTLPEIWP